jgi:hypothetical protein
VESTDLTERLRLRRFDSPFEDWPREQVDRFFAQFGAEHQRNYTRGLSQLEVNLGSVDPVRLLSNLASYLLFHPQGTDIELTQDRPVLPFHLEFIQALVLMRDRSDFGWDLHVRPDLVQSVCDMVRDVAESWAHAGFARVTTIHSEQDRARLMAQTRIRHHTAAVRNWGFPDQMVRIVTQLLEPLDLAVEGETGLAATKLLQMQAAIVSLVEGRYNDQLQRMGRVFAAPSVQDAVSAYYREFPGLRDGEVALATLLEQQDVTLDQAKTLLLLHGELSYPDLYTLSLDDIVACYPGTVDRQALLLVAAGWSLTFGDLKGCEPAHFFLDNPVWTRPLIRLDADTFFCPLVGLLHSFGLGMIEEFLSSHPKLVERYETRRSRYLESEVEALFRRHFPSATVFAGSKWWNPVSGRNGENDLLVVLDEYGIVVEAKAGKITGRALRGHPQRLEKTVDALVVKPTRQGRRFAELLEGTPECHQFETERGAINTIDSSRVRQYLVLSVTLELFSLLALRWPILRDAGLIPSDVEPAVTLSLVDLEVLLQALDTEARRLHYLSRRTDLEEQAHFVGDELDLLAYYLQTGFHLGELEFAESFGVDLGLQSKLIDRLFQDPPSARTSDWAGTRLATLWQILLKDLDHRKPLGWTSASLRLLDVPYDDQLRLVKRLDEAARKARRAARPRASSEARLASGPKRRRQELVVAAFKGFDPDEAAARAENLAARTKERRGGEPVVVYLRLEDRFRPRVAL